MLVLKIECRSESLRFQYWLQHIFVSKCLTSHMCRSKTQWMFCEKCCHFLFIYVCCFYMQRRNNLICCNPFTRPLLLPNFLGELPEQKQLNSGLSRVHSETKDRWKCVDSLFTTHLNCLLLLLWVNSRLANFLLMSPWEWLTRRIECFNQPTFMMPQGGFPAPWLLSAELSRLPLPILGLLFSLYRPLV